MEKIKLYYIKESYDSYFRQIAFIDDNPKFKDAKEHNGELKNELVHIIEHENWWLIYRDACNPLITTLSKYEEVNKEYIYVCRDNYNQKVYIKKEDVEKYDWFFSKFPNIPYDVLISINENIDKLNKENESVISKETKELLKKNDEFMTSQRKRIEFLEKEFYALSAIVRTFLKR
jgi:hypothetical protein